MKQLFYLLSAVIALMASAITFGQTAKPVNPLSESSPTAPAFSVVSLEGEKFELAALRGKIVVLNFWFTGCQPCIEEMPELNSLVDKFKNENVVFIAPTWDKVSILQTFLKEHPFKYHVVPDAHDLILRALSDGTGDIVFPTHLVIDREGRIDTRIKGVEQLEDLQKAIARLVKSPSQKTK